MRGKRPVVDRTGTSFTTFGRLRVTIYPQLIFSEEGEHACTKIDMFLVRARYSDLVIARFLPTEQP
jgi:hypothetical protein